MTFIIIILDQSTRQRTTKSIQPPNFIPKSVEFNALSLDLTYSLQTAKAYTDNERVSAPTLMNVQIKFQF
jgi:hypothetical protein